jgi:hypothetical protein
MMEGQEAEKRKPATIFCDPRILKDYKQEVKRQGMVLADEFNDLFTERLRELRGTQTDANGAADRERQYEDLKREHTRLYSEWQKRKEPLARDKDGFLKVNKLLENLGLRHDLSNLADVLPSLMAQWEGDLSYLHEFVSLLELALKTKQVQKRLMEMRGSKLRVEPDKHVVQTSSAVLEEAGVEDEENGRTSVEEKGIEEEKPISMDPENVEPQVSNCTDMVAVPGSERP